MDTGAEEDEGLLAQAEDDDNERLFLPPESVFALIN